MPMKYFKSTNFPVSSHWVLFEVDTECKTYRIIGNTNGVKSGTWAPWDCETIEEEFPIDSWKELSKAGVFLEML